MSTSPIVDIARSGYKRWPSNWTVSAHTNYKQTNITLNTYRSSRLSVKDRTASRSMLRLNIQQTNQPSTTVGRLNNVFPYVTIRLSILAVSPNSPFTMAGRLNRVHARLNVKAYTLPSNHLPGSSSPQQRWQPPDVEYIDKQTMNDGQINRPNTHSVVITTSKNGQINWLYTTHNALRISSKLTH